MKRRITAFLLAFALVLSLASAALAADGMAKASTQSVAVDGTPVEFQMYALESAEGLTNYVKLRDVAHVLNSTPARFSVGYDGTISITTGEAYTDNGSEMTTPYSGDRAYQPGPGAVKVNGSDVSLDAIVLTDDNGGAYTYFKLRDLGTALGFRVDWTGERGVFIETGAAPETPAQPSAPAASDLTLADFSGVWRREVELISGNTGVREYIFTGDQYEQVTYDKSGVPNEDGYGPYWYESGTVTLGKNIYSTTADTTFPYVLDLHARERYTGAAYGNTSNTFSFSLREANPAAGYLLDRNGERYDKVESSLYCDAAKAKMEAHKAAEAAAQAAGEDYAFNSLQYIYNRLKFPETMQDVTILAGPYDRSGESGAIYSTTDKYYVVNISCKAANSFGVLTSETYVFLFDLTTGKADYNWEDRIEQAIDSAYGERKLAWMELRSEAIGLRAGGQFTPLPRETVDRLVAEVRNMG